MNEQMKDRLDDDYYAITNLIDALREELDICDDAVYKGLGLSACYLFSSSKTFVDIACTDTYSHIAGYIKYAHGFVSGSSLAFDISDKLTNAVNDAAAFGGAWCVDTDEQNEYMHRLADMLHGYVYDNGSFFNELFYECAEV